MVEFIEEIRAKDPGIGIDKIWPMFNDRSKDQKVGRDKMYAIAEKYDLKLRDKTRKPRTTDSRHSLPTYPNLVKNIIPKRPNQIWVADITYILICCLNGGKEFFAFLSLLMDSYTKEVVGYWLSESLSKDGPMTALNQALSRLEDKNITDLTHHSDRGVQYASYDYTGRLLAKGIKISMTESGDPKDNSQAERLNNTIKNEILRGRIFHSVEEARAVIDKAIDFYNNERPHMSLGNMTPRQAAQCTGMLPKLWYSYRENAIMGTR